VLATASDDDRELLATSVWIDVLHDESLVVEAWNGLTDPLPDGIVLSQVLEISGPVPSSVKQPLLESLAVDPGWHDSIIQALWFGLFEDHGRIDVAAARTLAVELQPTIAVSEYEDVCAALEQLPDDAHSFTSWQAAQPTTVDRLHLASARAATTLDRRRRERRRHGGTPPVGMQERRVMPDRRGSRPDAITFSIPNDEPSVEEEHPGEHSSLVTRVLLVVAFVMIVALAAWWGSGNGF
jgi:hypothetical protein